MIDLIVFDLAGTTVKDNKDVHRCLQKAMGDFNVVITVEEANLVMGIPKPVAIHELLKLHNYHLVSQTLIDDIHRAFVREMVRFYEEDDIEEKAGVSMTFQILKNSGIKIAVDTGFDRAVTAPLLERLGWMKDSLIDASVTSDEVPRGRPHPDLIFKAMELTGISDSKSVMKVGDTVSDLQEGRAAGCRYVVGVTTGAFSREQMMNEPYTHLIEEIPEVLSILDIR